MTRRKQRVLTGIAVALVLLGIGVLLQPLGLPWILPPLAARYGVAIGRMERVGLGRFVLHQVAWSNQQVRVSAAHVEVPVPTVLLWNHLLSNGSELKVRDWILSISARSGEQIVPAESARTVFDRTMTTWQRLNRWFSRASIMSGSLELRQQTSAIPRLDWSHGVLIGETRPVFPSLGVVPVNFSIRFEPGGSLSAALDAPSIESGVEFLAGMADDELGVRAVPYWRTNRALVQARFGAGPLPAWAHLSATQIAVPAIASAVLGPSSAKLDIDGSWTNETFGFRLMMVDATNASGISAERGQIRAHGNLASLTLDEVSITGSRLGVELATPVDLKYRDNWIERPARMAVAADLGRLSIPGLIGGLLSDVELQPNPGGAPVGNFRFAFTNASYLGWDVSGTTGTLELRWPMLQFELARARSPSGLGLEIEASARADLDRHEVLNAAVRVSGGGPLNPPEAGVAFSNFSFRATAAGPIRHLQHEATTQIRQVQVGPLTPLDLEIREQGSGLQILDLRALAAGTEMLMDLKGSLRTTDSTVAARWDGFNVWTGLVARSTEGFLALPTAMAKPLWSLAEPVTMQGSGPGGWRGWNHFDMTPWRWVGEDRRLSIEAGLAGPERGRLQISAVGARLGDFTNLLADPIPWQVLVEKLELGAWWTNGPADLSFEIIASLGGPRMPEVIISASATNSTEGVVVPTLRMSMATKVGGRPDQEVVHGHATVPISAQGTAAGFGLIVHSNAPFHLELQASTNRAVAELLATFAKVEVTNASAQIVLDGPIRQPRGTVVLLADSIGPRSDSVSGLPRFEGFRADLTMDAQQIRVRDLRATVAGRPLVATADVPYFIGTGEGIRYQWDQARARLQATDADLATWAALAPGFMAPRGRLDLDLSLEPDFQLRGLLRVVDAGTTSLPGLGPIGGIDARVLWRGHTAVIEHLGARLAGSLVVTTGEVNFGDWRPGTKAWPAMDLGVTATNLAFIRESQKILRGDVDLRVTNALNAMPSIVGEVSLREGLFLASLTDLVPHGVTEVGQRPPYFGVSSPLIRRWPLRVRVRGEKFLSVRTTLFHGQISASLEVQGDLGEPVAVGQVQIGSGAVTFPFATLPVRQGFITLSSSDPYDPGLFVNAAGRAYDYDLRLEVTGTAQKPRLEFTSVPPLTSEQILLMVTSGKIPRDDFALTTQQRAERLGMFLGKDVLSQLGLGGSSDRLVIHSGESISENGRSTYSIEYKLTDNVSLVGEYDRFDEYNAGIQWRVYSR